MTLKTLLQVLLLPPTGALLLAILGACLAALCRGARARRTGWALLAAGLATLWLLTTPVVANALNEAAHSYPPLDLTQPTTAQAIVILGGGSVRPAAPEYGGPAAGDGLLERLAYGAFVARHTHLPLLVTGAGEAQGMRATLARDFQLETRWVEPRAHDTFQNAQFSAPLLKAAGVTRIILVTDDAHQWRATREFESAGLAVVPAPEGRWLWRRQGPRRYLPDAGALEGSTRALHELVGDVARRAFAALGVRRHEA